MSNSTVKFWALETSTKSLSLRLIQEYLKPYRRACIFGLVCMAVGAACTALLAKQMEPIIDEVFVARNAGMLMVVALQVFVIFLLKGLSDYGSSVTMTHVGEKIVADMRSQLVAHVLRADLSFYHATPSGELISRFTTDVNMLHRVVSRTLTSLGKDSLTLIFLIGFMFYTDWLLASLAFFAFPLAIFPILRIGKRMRKSSGLIQRELASFTVLLSQIFNGARLIKSYGMLNHECKKANSLIQRVFKLVMKATRTRSASHPIMELLGGCAIAAVIYYGGYQVIAGHQKSGAFFAFITALLLAYEPLKKLANLNAELQEKLAAATRVFAVLDMQPKIVSLPDAKPLKITKGAIEFSKVNFSYTKEQQTIDHIDLLIPAGKKVALVGSSGSGKSTLMNLISRFYDIEDGSITIDGQAIRDVTLESLRHNIALVSQEVTLFDDTVKNNIIYGRPDANLDEIQTAARAAAAHDFIQELPQGYETLVGEHGIKLSGGQRQRLAIARAMLKNAPILLLDEATSALDSESEQQIQAALNSLMRGRTTLVIAHRLSTVLDSDIIYVIEQGRVVASGPHKQLLASNERYAKLCKAQLSDPTHVSQTSHQKTA
ncbi:MAG: ABC transporter transmembrane domain-containing protein [Pseudomonadota bacterium]